MSHPQRRSVCRPGVLRGVVTRAILVLCSSLIAFGAAELALRWRFGRPVTVEGDWIDLTKLGFRYGTYRTKKDPMTVRVVGIGDSFAFAPVAPPHNYHQVLEGMLRSRLGRPVEVINLGRPGIGPAAEFTILRDLAMRFEPDLVVWMFFTGNDFTDDQPGTTYDLAEVLGTPSWMNARVDSMRLRWYDRFLLSGYVKFLLACLSHAEIAASDSTNVPVANQATFLRVECQRMSFMLDDGALKSAFGKSVRPHIDAAIELSTRRSIPFVLAVAPDQAEIEEDLGRMTLRRLTAADRLEASDRVAYAECLRDGDLKQLTVAHDSLATFTARGATVVDLYESFRREGASGGLYLERHTHWNEAGNRLAAEVLVDPVVACLRTSKETR